VALINDLLDLSRIEAGKLASERVPVDLTLLVKRVVTSPWSH
jgi:signal transduction histidine kinase